MDSLNYGSLSRKAFFKGNKVRLENRPFVFRFSLKDMTVHDKEIRIGTENDFLFHVHLYTQDQYVQVVAVVELYCDSSFYN